MTESTTTFDIPIIHTRSAQRVESSPVEWLWPGRIPLGKLTLLVGDPGVGKSFLTADLAARVSQGAALPEDDAPLAARGDVLMFSAEDDPGDTIKPRLEAAGADLSRVHFGGAVDYKDGRAPEQLRLDRHMGPVLDTVALFPEARLLIIDPITAYMGDADANSNAPVREMLAQLASIAQATGVAIVVVTHLNKNTTSRVMYRAMGSLAFTAAARCVYAIAKDPDVPERRLIAPVKANVPVRAGALAYRIVDGVMRWEKAPTVDLDELHALVPEATGAIDEAVSWLLDGLKNGPRPAAEMLLQAGTEGISEATLRRARPVAGVESCREPGRHGRWMWRMDGAAPDAHTGSAGV